MQTEDFAFTQTISELDELQEIVKGSDLGILNFRRVKQP
jgi:hypothetical protein